MGVLPENKSPEQMKAEEEGEAKMLAFAINERARRTINQKVRERAEMWVKKLMGEGGTDPACELRNWRSIEMEGDFEKLIKKIDRDLMEIYQDWTDEEIKELYGILYDKELEVKS